MPDGDPYGPQFARAYDLTYRLRGKDYAAEAAHIARVARDRRPGAAALLDVACGTGEHLAHLRACFSTVAGLDGSSAMLQQARAKLPGVPLVQGDMRDFDLRRRFDVVTCLFSAIGYLASVSELRAAVAAMARHLVPGGVLIVEPLWRPEQFLDGHVSAEVLEHDGQTLSRMSHSTRAGRTARMEIHYLVADGTGLQHFAETHLNTLFTSAEYLDAVAAAGCDAEFLPEGPAGRGLLVGVLDRNTPGGGKS
jgi:SAM-dependent methyltransferase